MIWIVLLFISPYAHSMNRQYPVDPIPENVLSVFSGMDFIFGDKPEESLLDDSMNSNMTQLRELNIDGKNEQAQASVKKKSRSKNSSILPYEVQYTRISINDSYKCNTCGEIIESYDKYNRNHKKIHEPKIECKFCGKKYKLPYALHKHIQDKKCLAIKDLSSENDLAFISQVLLETNKIIHGNNHTEFKCSQCGFVCASKTKLYDHSKVHRRKPPSKS